VFATEFKKKFTHRRTITDHYDYLTANLDVKYSSLLDRLYADAVINDREMETIRGNPIPHVQIEELLSLLKRKTKDKFDKFLDALNSTGQHYIRDHITGDEVSHLRRTLLAICDEQALSNTL